jgi:hypothetical protein
MNHEAPPPPPLSRNKAPGSGAQHIREPLPAWDPATAQHDHPPSGNRRARCARCAESISPCNLSRCEIAQDAHDTSAAHHPPFRVVCPASAAAWAQQSTGSGAQHISEPLPSGDPTAAQHNSEPPTDPYPAAAQHPKRPPRTRRPPLKYDNSAPFRLWRNISSLLPRNIFRPLPGTMWVRFLPASRKGSAHHGRYQETVYVCIVVVARGHSGQVRFVV